jgi:hypothetical protein
MNGYGILTSASSGDRYEGEWKDDKRNGYAVCSSWMDGGKTLSKWRDDKGTMITEVKINPD